MFIYCFMKSLLHFATSRIGRVFLLIFPALVWMQTLKANQIDIGIFGSSTSGKIEVRIRPDYTIPGNQTFTGILYTLRWTDPAMVITTVDNITPFNIIRDGTPILEDGYYHQKFYAVPMGSIGTPIPANSERLISSFSYTGSTGSYFELIDNEWTQDNNGGPSLEILGTEYYGIIYQAFAPVPCMLSLTCPGNMSVPPAPGGCGATVTYSAPVVTGNCSDVTVVQIAGLPSGSYFPAGTTTNVFQATSSEGVTTTCSFTVTVTSLPGSAGSITGTPQVCRGQAGVAYSVEPITNATSYIWTYTGAGATIIGSGNSITINFSNLATSGNLKVYGVNNCGSGTVSPGYHITVNLLPSPAGSIAGTSSVCQGQNEVPFSVSTIPYATSYVWNYSGTGATISGSGPSVSISFSGTATSGNLTVYGVNACGNGIASPNHPVTVNTLPGTAGTINGITPVCQGQSNVPYSVAAIPNAASYVWSFSGTGATISGTGASVLISFSLSATSGNLTVYAMNACGNGAPSPDFSITVNPLPGAAGVITGTTPVCQGQNNVAYSVIPVPNATNHNWSYSGTGATINGNGTPAITINFSSTATSGNLTVCGSNSCGNGTTSPDFSITVNSVPGAAGPITGTSPVCQGQNNIAYSVEPVPNATSYVWTYSGTGATITGTGTSVTINFSTSATSGNLKVYGVNACGNGAVSPNYSITVNPLPGTAGTISGTSPVCQGQNNVAYSVPAIPNATSYVWSYSGTGATINGSGTSVTINFSSAATSGNLTVHGVNGCGNGTVSPPFAVSVNTLPSAPTSGGDKVICANQMIPALIVTVGTGETADWYAGASGGIPLATGTLSYTPAAAGTYYAEARNIAGGCLSTSRTAVTLTIHALPDVFAGADQSIPNGTSTTINDATASGAPALSYSWTPASSFVNPLILNPTTVNLFVTNEYTLTVTDGHGCADQDQMTIIVTGGPLAVNPSADPDALCPGEPTQLYANASGGSGSYTYTWTSNPVGFTSAQANPQANPTITTTFTVVVNDGFNNVSGNVTVTLHSLPQVYAGADRSIPYGTSTTLSDATATGESPLTYSWTPAAAFVNPEVLNPTTVNLTSTTNCTLTVTDGHGCTDSDQVTITVTGSALTVNSAADPDNFCPGESSQLSANASGGSGTYTYSWTSDPAGFTSTLANPGITPTTTTTYTVVVNDGFNSVTDAVVVTVHPLPAVFAGADQNVLYGTSTTINDATASGAVTLSYEWTPSAVFVDPSLLNPVTVNLTSSSTCTLTVTDGHGCVDDDQVTLTVTGGALAVDPAADPDTVCFSETSQLSANASGGSGTYTYSWTSDPAGFTSSQANAQVTPAATTTYTVVVNDGFNTMTGTVTVVVVVLEVTCPENIEVFLDDPAFELSGGLPAGGTYTGDGVAGGVFEAAEAGLGEHTITYTYENGIGCIDFCTFQITVSGNVIPGDANCDGFVNVLDIITIVNYIMELNPVPFCFPEADVNNDLIINVMDIIGTVNIIMAP